MGCLQDRELYSWVVEDDKWEGGGEELSGWGRRVDVMVS